MNCYTIWLPTIPDSGCLVVLPILLSFNHNELSFHGGSQLVHSLDTYLTWKYKLMNFPSNKYSYQGMLSFMKINSLFMKWIKIIHWIPIPSSTSPCQSLKITRHLIGIIKSYTMTHQSKQIYHQDRTLLYLPNVADPWETEDLYLSEQSNHNIRYPISN